MSLLYSYEIPEKFNNAWFRNNLLPDTIMYSFCSKYSNLYITIKQGRINRSHTGKPYGYKSVLRIYVICRKIVPVIGTMFLLIPEKTQCIA